VPVHWRFGATSYAAASGSGPNVLVASAADGGEVDGDVFGSLTRATR
jgi:hypothetical protein